MDENGCYGVLDFTGQVRAPFRYSQIRYVDVWDGLCVTDAETGKMGFLDAEDFSVTVPVIYDSLTDFKAERAVVRMDGKSGVIRSDGTLETSLLYDKTRAC